MITKVKSEPTHYFKLKKNIILYDFNFLII